MDPESSSESELSLVELSRVTEVPARTIRYYIARGLLPGPDRAGRGAAYGPEHVERLRSIRRLQRQGLSLVEIRRRLVPGDQPVEPPAPEPWLSYRISDDVTVTVRADAPPWRLHRVEQFLAEAVVRLGKTEAPVASTPPPWPDEADAHPGEIEDAPPGPAGEPSMGEE